MSYKLNAKQQEELFKALFYLKVNELKLFCDLLDLPFKGEKIILIKNIKYYILTGKVPEVKTMPDISQAKTKVVYPLLPNTKILYGSFKNDLKTRNFLKTLIGNHFHYTAFGIDWIKEKWFSGEPLTYAEFATYWQSEYLIRQETKGPLKPEWALLNFLERYQNTNPNTSKIEAMTAWKKVRKEQFYIAKAILEQFIF